MAAHFERDKKNARHARGMGSQKPREIPVMLLLIYFAVDMAFRAPKKLIFQRLWASSSVGGGFKV